MTRALLQRYALFALVWRLAVEGRQDAWGIGLVGAAAATGASFVLLPPGNNRVSAAGLCRFLGFFLWQSAKSGVQVAAIALRGRLDLRPAVIELSLGLLALVLAGLVVRSRMRAPAIPPGDVLVWLERLAARTMRLCLRGRLVEERR